jgi:hypothetical protein
LRQPEKRNHNPPELLWFGHSSNIDSLINVLNGYLNQHAFNLNVVSNVDAFEVIGKTRFTTPPKCKMKGTIWIKESLQKVASNCDACIIPTNKIYASVNRLVTALNFGFPVLADETYSTSKLRPYFSKFSVANIKRMLSEPDQFHDMVCDGQAVSRSEFSKERLLGLWTDLLKSYC